MVEVFKTNVTQHEHAKILIDQIHGTFSSYKANFDLADCDNILRVKCSKGTIQPVMLISLLQKFGFYAEVLPDTTPIFDNAWISSGKSHVQYLKI